MADGAAVPIAGEEPGRVPLSSQVRQWGSWRDLSSLHWWENQLAARPFERMPWLAVAMLAGIGAWFALPSPAEWLIFLGVSGLCAGGVLFWMREDRFPFLRGSIVAVVLMLALGTALIWARSTMVGSSAIGRPIVDVMTVYVLEREDARENSPVRLYVVTHDIGKTPTKARISVPDRFDSAALRPGATLRARVRLIPPTRAVVPGAYDFARIAWFEGIVATGSVMDEPAILSRPSAREEGNLRQRVASHVRKSIATAGGEASSAAIAATLTTADRSGMAGDDAQAMRDAGLAHLLSISGLHVGAVIAIAWWVALRSLALWPWLALRVPLPLVAAATGALAGIGYTLLTGAALPTVRACIAALLVLLALALGRQALSMRLVAVAAMAVMLFWPEAVIGPSFQLSFAAVIAIVALHNTETVARWREKVRDASLPRRVAGWFALLFLTGLVVEVTLMPLVLFHFHRAGLYGAGANLIAIPLTTLAIMPLLGLGLLADLVGLGAPFWWLTATAIDALLEVARATAGAPGAVKFAPLVPVWLVSMIAAGGLWLALWSGRLRLAGLVPIAVGLVLLFTLQAPDMLVSGDGRQVMLKGAAETIYSLRDGEGFDREVMLEMMGAQTGSEAATLPLSDWPGARCNASFCAFESEAEAGEGGLSILLARGHIGRTSVGLAEACAASDIVIAESALPPDCAPRWLKLDGRELSRRGGAAIDFAARRVSHVRPAGDRHGW